MRQVLVVGNWKMNMLRADAVDFIQKAEGRIRCEAWVSAPFTLLYEMHRNLKDPDRLRIGAQNVYFEEKGAYTGEVSADMLKDAGARFVILGHSERRMYFGETDEAVSKKTAVLLEKGLIPVVCCGERAGEKDAKGFVAHQIRTALGTVSASDWNRVVVAYEPIWAIGTGKTPSPEEARGMIAHIRSTLVETFGDAAEEVRILYGGSVTPSNVRLFTENGEIDGVLVGGASLKADSFVEMVNAAAMPAAV